MRVSYSWLKEYVDIKVAPEKLAQLLTMAGIEVISLDNVDNDAIFEIEVTPNRPDCLGVIGIAREIAAITGKKLQSPKIILEKDTKGRLLNFGLKIVDKKGCPRYVGRTIANVKVGPSPAWLKRRLEAVGIRCINNIADITNYVLLETGQPLHAFDFDKLCDGKIVVRRAKVGEKIIAIDGQEKQLDHETLVIADGRRPVAIAGIMGGEKTEVTRDTRNILLESAYFDPILIRRASRRLGVSSESSYRFERGIDKNNVLMASMRAANLINDLAKSKLMHAKDCCTEQFKIKKTKVPLNTININNLLGKDIPLPQIISILKNLGFAVSKKTARNLIVEAPSFREDVNIEADLVEEIARIYGYANIPSSLPAVRITDIKEAPLSEASQIIKNILIAQGLDEVITYSLLSQDLLQKANLDFPDLTKIANPLSNEQELLRPSLLVGLLNCVANNYNHNIDNVRIFEFGNIVQDAKEIPTLGIALTGLKCNDWLRRIQEQLTLFDLKGTIEAVLFKLGIEDYEFLKRDFPFFKKGSSAVLKVKDAEVGFLGEISAELIERWGIKKKEIFASEINIEKIFDFKNLNKIYQPLINFPSIKRDISLIANIELSVEQIVKIIKEESGVYLKSIVLLEQYIGKQIPSGSKGLSFALEYQAQDRTLKDEEANSFHNKICEALSNKLKVRIR